MTTVHELLLVAIEWGNLRLVKNLLAIPEVIGTITANDNGALRWAVLCGHLAIVKLLLSYPEVAANVVANSNFVINWATKNGHLKVVNLLEEAMNDNLT